MMKPAFDPQARSVAAALAHWRDSRGVQMDIIAMPGYQELSAPVSPRLP